MPYTSIVRLVVINTAIIVDGAIGLEGTQSYQGNVQISSKLFVFLGHLIEECQMDS